MVIPWNLTRHLAAQESADVIVISPAKAGRTWLRVMVNKYISLRYGVPFSVDNLHEHDAKIPSIVWEHWLWLHLRLATFKQRLRGRYIIPARVLNEKKLVLLVRDPRDIVVSAYFQESKRESKHKRTEMPIQQYLRDRKRGIASVVRVLNLTHQKTRELPHTLVVKYEAMKANPTAELRRVLEFSGIPIDEPLLAQAVEFGSFDNMKKMEQSDEFNSPRLRPGDPHDADSFKVRKGKIGGYKDYFDADDIAYLEPQVAKLDPVFGYGRSATYNGQ